MLLVQLTTVLALRLDVYAVRLLGSMAAVGLYALVVNLSELLLHLARPFALVVFTGTARGNDALRLRLPALTRALVAAGCVMGAAAFFGRDEIIGFLFGKSSAGSGPILLLRMPGALAAAVTMLLGGVLLGRGRTDLVCLGNLLGVATLSLAVVPLSLWATTRGTAVAFTIAALVQLLWIASALRSVRAGTPGRALTPRSVLVSWAARD